MAGILRVLLIGLVLLVPLPRIARSRQPLTWPKAVALGTYLTAIALIFIAEIPSRILYYIDSRSSQWIEQVPQLRFALNPGAAGQSLLADVAANTVQGIFFIIIVVIVYFWGERQRKQGRFSRR